jgi:hypothetical protein
VINVGRMNLERDYLIQLLTQWKGNVSRVSRESGRDRRTIQRQMTKHKLTSESFRKGRRKMPEHSTYPWTMKMFGQDPYVPIKEAETALDVVRQGARQADEARARLQADRAVFEGAAKQMAERAVHAETQAEILKLERDQLKSNLDRALENQDRQNDSYRHLWIEFWLRQGFSPDRVVKALMSTFELSAREAESLIKSMGHASYSFDMDHSSRDDSNKRERWIKAAIAFRESA